MVNLETTYLGLQLKNPLVAASSGLTNSVDKIQELETIDYAKQLQWLVGTNLQSYLVPLLRNENVMFVTKALLISILF